MTTDTDQQESLTEALSSAIDETGQGEDLVEEVVQDEVQDEPEGKQEEEVVAEQAVDADAAAKQAEDDLADLLEPAPKWDRRYKDAFNSLHAHENGREVQQAILDLYKEGQSYTTQVEQERADLRKEAESWTQTVEPYRESILQSGQSPQDVVRRMLGVSMALSRDPQGTLARLAETYGVDLQAMTQEERYIPPEVKALEDRLRRQEAALAEQREQAQARQEAQLRQHIAAFVEAVDESGQPKHPHVETVTPIMTRLMQAGQAQNLEDAYEQACKLSPDVATQEETRKEARSAARKAAEAKKAQQASRRATGTHTGTAAKPQKSLRDELSEAVDQSKAA